VPRKVSVAPGRSKYLQDITVGPHKLQADEPSDVGGGEAAPTPYELLLAALGACTSITVQMYAERRRWPLEGVHVELSYAKVHADDCASCDTEVRTIERIEREISLLGDLSEEQRQRLMDIADKCPLHRTLTSQIEIRTRQTAGVKRGM